MGFGWMNVHAVARSHGCSLIRISFGEKKSIYWTMSKSPKRRWICCEFSPLDPIHIIWIEEVLEKLGYKEISSKEKEIPDIHEWFIRKGRYYWVEEGPCPRGWRTEDTREDEQD